MLSTKLKEAAGNSADATLYVDDVFSTYLYDGAGASQTINNGIDLAGKGGMVWIKQRNGPSAHNLRDTVRGNNYALNSALTNAQSSGWSTVFNFTSTGYAITGTNDQYNGAGGTYASWTFRKAAKFFDVVTWTGDGVAGRSIAHSLGVTPGMIIVKRTDTTGNWQVYHNGLTSAAYSIQLNLTAAQASAPTVWNSTAPTSSVFSVGTDATVNASGGTYVAYLYAHDTSSTGIIQCGSVTTNVSVPVDVNLGWEPQYVLIRVTDITGNWYILDTMRGYCVASSDYYLAAQSSASEGPGDFGYPTATGFTLTNLGTHPYIYLAIRRPNKPPTSGTQVYLPVASSFSGSTVTNTGFVTDTVIVRGNRSINPDDQFVYDRLRGCNNSSQLYLTADSTQSEFSGTGGVALTGTVTIQNGFLYQTSASTPIAWAFKRAPGFFDEVCYTGTGVATTKAHNLTVVPELMIVKCRGNTGKWVVYNPTIGNNKYLVLNAINSASIDTYWNNTTPTSSVFSIGTAAVVNTSGDTYVAYLFATLAGISKVGSYTGNGTTQTINCGFTGGARFVLIKRTDSTGDWYVFDTARGMTTLTDPYLLLNSTAAEVATLGAVTSVTTGFAVNAAIVAAINTNAASYIYLSIA